MKTEYYGLRQGDTIVPFDNGSSWRSPYVFFIKGEAKGFIFESGAQSDCSHSIEVIRSGSAWGKMKSCPFKPKFIRDEQGRFTTPAMIAAIQQLRHAKTLIALTEESQEKADAFLDQFKGLEAVRIYRVALAIA